MIENKPISQGSPQGKTVDDYKGEQKWCFAIVLNRACDNYEDNYKKNKSKLFSESLLKFEEVNRKDWFDEEIRKLIVQMDTEDSSLRPKDPKKIREGVNYSQVNRILNDIRNYFSHYYHIDSCLHFPEKDSMRIIMEKAYEKAQYYHKEVLKKETDIQFPALFEKNGKITSAGVVFLASFFVERRILHRPMGYVGGFKKTEGEYNITREIFTTYCLKDSYSIHTPDPKAVMFRDILGYLSRVPSEYYQHNKEQCDKENHPERKTDKFIFFALKYLEDFALNELKDHTVSVARMEIIREETKETDDDCEQYKPYPDKGKVKVIFDSSKKELPYYINHNTVILQSQKNGGRVRSCKIGINELKYLILLCLQGRVAEAIKAIDNYIYRIEQRFASPAATIKAGEDESLIRGLPEFVRIHSGIETQDEETEKNNRLDYIREKWNKKKTESSEMELHRKGRDILRYINWHCSRELGVEEYNFLLTLLIDKDLAKFNEWLAELKRTERIEGLIYNNLKGFSSLNPLHLKVCELVLAELDYLEKNDPKKLAEVIGLVKEETEKTPSYEDKVKAFVNQPMIYKGFLRENVFKENKKTFAKLVGETLGRLKYLDVPLGKEYYYVPSLDRFDKNNAVLYETLAQDRLCAMMARACYGKINDDLRKKGEQLIWQEETGKEIIILELQNPARPGSSFSIRFSVTDYTKLYVMDDAAFLSGLMLYFFPKEKTIDYHKLYSDGINKYTELQRQGIGAIFVMEEKIIKDKNIPMAGNYIGFKVIMTTSGYLQNEQATLNKVRNAFLHYHLGFRPDDFKMFVAVMAREGIREKGEWNLKI
jgi:hypothetical protein